MSINLLSTEILQKIYEYATINSVINLSQTSKKNHGAYLGQQLPILRKALYNSSYSPYPELMKLYASDTTIATRNPIGTEVRRRYELEKVVRTSGHPHLNMEAIKKIVGYANVVQRWVEIYPQLRWRYDSNNRRLLRPHEAERLRKALYQNWTYYNLFHNQLFCEFAPEPPRYGISHRDDLRLRLARTWTTIDIVRQSEMADKLSQLMEIDIFPSNTMLQHQYAQVLPVKMLERMAWGEDQDYRHLSGVLGKLSPADILHLYENTTTKPERLQFLVSKGRWFSLHLSTWESTVERVISDDRKTLNSGGKNISLPTSYRSLVPPYVDLHDREVEYGIIDSCEAEGPTYYDTHLYANDASSTGNWVPESERLSASWGPGLWKWEGDISVDGEGTSSDDRADEDSSDEDSEDVDDD